MSLDISVVIPTYKRDSLITCLESIIDNTVEQQKLINYEVLIVAREMGETLREDIERRFQPIVKVIPYDLPGNGPAKNYAIEKYAKGEFIAFTDDDCVVSPNWLLELRRAQKATNADIVSGSCFSGIGYNPYLNAHQAHIEYYLNTLIYKDGLYPRTVCGTTMNMLVRKSKFLELGGFDSAFARHYGDDRMFNVRWAADAHTRAVFNRHASVWHCHNLTFKSYFRLAFRYGIGIQQCVNIASIENLPIPQPPNRSEYGLLARFTLRNVVWHPVYTAMLVLAAQEVKRAGMRYARKHPDAISKNL